MRLRSRFLATAWLVTSLGQFVTAADSCSVRPENGLLAALVRAEIVAIATVDSTEQTDDGRTIASLALHEVLKASIEVEDGALMLAFDPWSGADSGWPLAGRLVLIAIERETSGGLRLCDVAIDLGDEGNTGARELVAALVASEDPSARAQALANAARSGGARTRLRAALDLESDVRHVAALDATSLEDLRQAMIVGASDGALPILATLFAMTNAPDANAIALSAIATPQGDAALVALRRMVKSGTLILSPEDLEPLLRADRDPAVRQRATDLLARVGSTWARARLLELVADADLDVGSEALVGLAGRAPDQIAAMCRDTIRTVLNTSGISAPLAIARQASPIERRLESRDLRMMRVEPYSGARLRLMAAGFVLARGDASDRQWITDRLASLQDSNLARFLRAMLATQFADFQDAW